MKYYVCLSQGEYSDYDPTYYAGDREITDEEFQKKGREVGDKVLEWADTVPTRPHVCDEPCFHIQDPMPDEPYDPKTGDRIYLSGEIEVHWDKAMVEWLNSEGFVSIHDKSIPEINTSYSDIPCSKIQGESV